MKNQGVLSLLGVSLCLWWGCAPAAELQDDPAAVLAAIQENDAAFMEAFNRGDMAAAAAVYTEDAIVLAPGAEMTAGRQAIQASMAADIEQFAMSGLTLSTTDVELAGDVAIAVGTYTIQMGDSSDNGKYLTVWKKQADGSWKLHRDIWNSNQRPDVDEPDDDEDPAESGG